MVQEIGKLVFLLLLPKIIQKHSPLIGSIAGQEVKMLPDGAILSTTPTPSAYLTPDVLVTSGVMDWERGGVAISDSSEGLNTTSWYAYISGDDAIVGFDVPSEYVVLTSAGISSVSIAFDRNMRLNIAYEAGGVSYFRWYDALTASDVTDVLTGCRSPRLTHDDKRDISDSTADILCCYLKGDSLCYRLQRDRYDTEYVLYTALPTTVRLRNVGMTTNNRIKFVIG